MRCENKSEGKSKKICKNCLNEEINCQFCEKRIIKKCGQNKNVNKLNKHKSGTFIRKPSFFWTYLTMKNLKIGLNGDIFIITGFSEEFNIQLNTEE